MESFTCDEWIPLAGPLVMGWEVESDEKCRSRVLKACEALES